MCSRRRVSPCVLEGPLGHNNQGTLEVLRLPE